MIAHTAAILWRAFAAAFVAGAWVWWTQRTADVEDARAELRRRALRSAERATRG